MSDPLFDVKTFFYLGNTQLAINEASKVRPRDEATKIEKDFYVYRSFIEQGNFSVVLDEIKSDSPAALQATRALAAYLSKAESKDATVSKLKSLEETGDELVALVAAIFYLHDNQLESALRAIFSSKRLDARALIVQILLKLNRPDLAVNELSAMQQINDLAVPTLLSQAWVGLAYGGDKIKESLNIYQDLIDKYGPSAIVLNGVGVALMMLKRYQDAENALLQSLEKNAKQADTIVNIITCSQHLHKPADYVNRYLTQLKSIAPNHPYVTELSSREASFDQLAAKFASS